MELNWRHIPEKLYKLHSPNISQTNLIDYSAKTDLRTDGQ
jgi:hypothetical protein